MRASSLLLILILTSCSLGKEEKKSADSDSATFIVDPVSAITEQDKSDTNFNSIATSRLYNFTACLKDVAMLEAIQGQRFAIKDGAREIKTMDTDSKGCLYWTEKFSYNSLKQENYSEILRTFEALGGHKGKQTVRLAINPWKNGTGASLDLRFQEAPKGMPGAKSSEVKSGLVIESVGADLEFTQSSNSAANAILRLNFEPKIRRLGLDSSPILESLGRGKLNLKVQLFARVNSGTAQTIIPISKTIEIQPMIENAQVKTDNQIEIIKKISRESIIEINFEVTPIDSPDGLGSVHGVVTLGRMTSLSISQKSPVREENISFIDSSTIKKDAQSEGSFDFLIGGVKIASYVVKELDANQNPKVLEIQYEACLKNSITQESILNKNFVVTPNDSSTIAPTDPDSGCLRWTENLNFDFFTRETYLKREFTFQSQDSFYGDAKKVRVVYVSPWQIVASGKGIYDEFFEGVPPKIAEGNTKSGSELVLDSIFFNFNQRSFNIDSQLNLSVVRTYRFNINPKINRITAQGVKTSGSGNGKYLVKLLLETIDKDFPEVIDAKTVEVESRSDSIVATVDFEYHDLRNVNSRNNLTIQIVPLGRANAIDSKPYNGTFDALSGFSVRLEPKMINIDERMKLAQAPVDSANRMGATYFLQKIQAEKFDAANLKKYRIPDQSALLDPSKSMVFRNLCHLFYSPYQLTLWITDLEYCFSDPNSYINIVRTEHVNKVYSSKLAGSIDTSTVNVSANMSYNEYESHDKTKGSTTNMGFDARLSLGASIPGLKAIGIDAGGSIGASVGHSWFWTQSVTKGNEQSKGKNLDHTRTMVVDEAHFSIDADVQKCVTFNKKGDEIIKNYYVCTDKDERKTVQEDYYFIYQPVTGSAIADQGAGAGDRPFTALIRGKDRFQTFINVLQDSNSTLSFTKDLPSANAVLKDSNNRYDGLFPGLLTPKQ